MIKHGNQSRIKDGRKRYTLDPASPFHRFAKAPASRYLRANLSNTKINLDAVSFTVKYRDREFPVAGTLDTGADESVGSLALHGNMGRELPMQGEDANVQVTLGDNATMYPVQKIVSLDVLVEAPSGEKEVISDMKTYLVDMKDWNQLLVGLPTLQKLGWVEAEFFPRQ